MKITCKLEYRLYIPSDYIAMTFVNMNFLGEDVSKYEDKWHEIKYKKLHTSQKNIDKIKSEMDKCKKNITDIRKTKNDKRLFNIFLTHEERKIINNTNININKMQLQIEAFEKDKWYTDRELHSMAERFLNYEGFNLIGHSSSGGSCGYQIEIWEKDV